MTDLTEVRVPDIGDFSDVPIIEILVEVGDRVRPEDPLVTLESDKATMDVPAPASGGGARTRGGGGRQCLGGVRPAADRRRGRIGARRFIGAGRR